jgi:transcription antitermination factor NusG
VRFHPDSFLSWSPEALHGSYLKGNEITLAALASNLTLNGYSHASLPGPDEFNEWFAFRVRPRHEKQVSIALREKGFVEFLPLYKSKRRWADRTKVVEMPLFPDYIFCSITRKSIVPVLMTSGIIDVVRAGSNPMPADNAEIEALQQTVRVNVPMESWPYTDVDEAGSFSILRGPLAGLRGILVEVRNSQRLILSVNLLRRSVLVEVHPEWISPCAPIANARMLA